MATYDNIVLYTTAIESCINANNKTMVRFLVNQVISDLMADADGDLTLEEREHLVDILHWFWNSYACEKETKQMEAMGVECC